MFGFYLLISQTFGYILCYILFLSLSTNSCDALTLRLVLGKGVINVRNINLLTYIILNNYLKNINLQKYFIYIGRNAIYSVLYIYYESHLLVLLGSHCLQNLTFTLTKSIQTLLVMDSYSYVGPIPTRIKTCAKLYSLKGIHKYGRPL